VDNKFENYAPPAVNLFNYYNYIWILKIKNT
jgi:hypothetical protein